MKRAIGLSVLFLLVVAVIIWVRPDPSARRRVPPPQFAPLVAEGEMPAPADDAFRAECFKSLAPLAEAWTVKGVQFTRSKAWGTVMRADYESPDLHGPDVNRLVCSKGPDGKMRVNITMGQKVTPLPTPQP